jgi:hypothetical protein
MTKLSNRYNRLVVLYIGLFTLHQWSDKWTENRNSTSYADQFNHL